MVAFDWIKSRDAPPLIIQLKFQSDWASLIGAECLHGMIFIKSAFDPITFSACIHVHPWLSTKSETWHWNWNFRFNSQKNFHNITGHYWCYTSEVKCLYCSVSHQCILALCHKKVGRMRKQRDTSTSTTYICCSSFSGTLLSGVFCIPAHAKAVLTTTMENYFLLFQTETGMASTWM